MKIERVYSADIYEKIMNAPEERKNDIFRYELMQPFESKCACYQIPLKAKVQGGYDIIRESEMLGYMSPQKIDDSWNERIQLIKDPSLWDKCQESIKNSLLQFTSKGINLPVENYLYSVILANPDSIYTKLSDGYSGDGGIPGYIFAIILPNKFTLNRLPAALAHECNHNVRFQFIKWRNDITLAEMMIAEGLAENFAVSLYGIENLGPWVSKVTMDELNDYIKPIIKGGLDVQGFDNITAYLYGDEIAKQRGYFPVGLPFCAGYACGYYMVKYYLDKTKEDIVDTTIRPFEEILQKIGEFWNE